MVKNAGGPLYGRFQPGWTDPGKQVSKDWPPSIVSTDHTVATSYLRKFEKLNHPIPVTQTKWGVATGEKCHIDYDELDPIVEEILMAIYDLYEYDDRFSSDDDLPIGNYERPDYEGKMLK